MATQQLDEESLKEKRKQRMMKAGWEARVRARKEKEREREEREAEEQREADERANDLSGWSERLRVEHESTMLRMKERARLRAALSDRKSAAAQNRMKNIASLAADDRVPKKRRKTGGGPSQSFISLFASSLRFFPLQRTCSAQMTKTGPSIARS